MKLKTLFLIGLFVILLFSCEEKSEIIITETKAELLVEIPISNETYQLKNTVSITNNSFTGTCIFCLGDSKNVKECANIIRISLEEGCILSFPGINDFDKINTLELELGFRKNNSDQFMMQIPINLKFVEISNTNGKMNINLDDIFLPLVKNMNINPENKFKINLTGYSDVPFSAQLQIPIVIESGNLSPRFTLF